MDNLLIEIVYDEDRDINTWIIYTNKEMVIFRDLLIKTHLNIHDIFLSPRTCFLIFLIDYEPKYGKIYKDIFLIHPSDMPEISMPVFCVNDRLLNTCFPDKSDMEEHGIKCKNINRINYLTVLDEEVFIMDSFKNENYHLVGVYCKDLLAKVRGGILKNDTIKDGD